MNKMFYYVLPGVYVCIRELIILLFSSFQNFQQFVMEATLKETKSSLEQLEKEHLVLKETVNQITRRNDALEETVNQITRRNDELEERIHLISTFLFPKYEETADDL